MMYQELPLMGNKASLHLSEGLYFSKQIHHAFFMGAGMRKYYLVAKLLNV